MPALASRGRGRRTINEINMVPFIDVMLVLLIIFMVTATVIVPGSINIPSAGPAPRAPEQRIDVMIDDQGRLSLGGEVSARDIGEDEAIARVKAALAANPQLAVMLAADSDLRYQQVMKLMGRLREVGVQRLGLAVR